MQGLGPKQQCPDGAEGAIKMLWTNYSGKDPKECGG